LSRVAAAAAVTLAYLADALVVVLVDFRPT
jgi:hypothetical protein